jgi:hypothetical protein
VFRYVNYSFTEVVPKIRAGFGLFGGLDPAVVLLSVVDLIIGLVYLIGLPKALNTTPLNILLDR